MRTVEVPRLVAGWSSMAATFVMVSTPWGVDLGLAFDVLALAR